MKKLILILITISIILNGCSQEQETIQEGGYKMKLTSPAFEHNNAIPSEYTCDGNNISPALNIENIPEEAKTLALIMDDPDAPVGTFVHWVVWNIPITTKEIKKGEEPNGKQGNTGFGKMGYGGPCPPSGNHRYFFKLYALDIELDLEEGASKQELEAKMQDHVLEKAELIGTYSRS